MPHPFYNAHHSPVGSFSSLTLGCQGPRGGLGVALAGPAGESIYVGVEDREGGRFRSLPFWGGSTDKSEDYDVEHLSEFTASPCTGVFADEEIERTMGAGIDEWKAGDMVFRVISPLRSLPDPESADPEDVKKAVCPAVLAEITIDNRSGRVPRKAFFGYSGSGRSFGHRVIREPGLTGVGQGLSTAIASDDPDVYAGLAFQPEKILNPSSPENLNFLLGTLGLVVGIAQPGEVRTFRFAVAFFVEGAATTGLATRHLYRRFFDRIEEVLSFALAGFDEARRTAEDLDRSIAQSLPPQRAWMLSHAIRSYLGSSQLLEREDGTPLWVVNEGEYRMMNTFDLAVDQAFLELALNPWTVRCVLDFYAERYSYTDGACLPGSSEVHPGGLAFTHDMGIAGEFSRPGCSGYEQSGLKGCFSYMSAEELMNWVLTAGLYDASTRDLAWAASHRATFLACLRSLIQRDHFDPSQRTGVVTLNGARCQGGGEITTYDSLDASLGPASNNLYLAVKGWAACRLLQDVLERMDEGAAAQEAAAQADLARKTIISAAGQDGLLPAVLDHDTEARIIPAIEALVYPYMAGLAIEQDLVDVLRRHLAAVLKPGICLFPDGGWKLSSTSRNSWLSKIYLCQFVAEKILGFPRDEAADDAHAAWLLDERNAFYAWSDQMLAGVAVGSRYYPRGVTAILWTTDGERRFEGLRELLFAAPLASCAARAADRE